MQTSPSYTASTVSTRRHAARRLGVMCTLALVASLAACGKPDDGKTVGQALDAAVANTENAAIDIQSGVKESAATAGTAIQMATQKAQVAAAQTGRAVAAKIDDAAITVSVAAGLAKDPDLSATKIDVDTTDGAVSIYGPAPSESARSRATDIARSVKGMVGVNNKLTIKSG